MIGLCRILAMRAWRDTRPHLLRVAMTDFQFGIVTPRADLGGFHVSELPASFRYYQLLDLCPLRMSREDQ